MEVSVVLIKLYTNDMKYIMSVLLNPEFDEIMYYTLHEDIDIDREVLNIYLDGVNYACDILLKECSMTFPLLESYKNKEDLMERIERYVPNKYKELVKEMEEDNSEE